MNKFFFIILFFNQFVVAQNLNDLQFGSELSLDVVSWNIEWFPKANTTSNYVQEIITNLEADIYALQEIEDTTLLREVISNIPNYDCHFKSSYYGGLAYVYNTQTIQVNSMYEIFTSNPYWNAFPRSPQVLNFSFLGNDYIIINNHFKCCGDGILDLYNSNDEEYRRLQAVNYLKQFIDKNFSNTNVIITGDLNDNLIDAVPNNVFQSIIDDNENYLFADIQIAQGSSIDWSYPSWPSHLDHMLITNELFDEFQNTNSLISVIKIDDFMGGWSNYDNNVSDHRPIGLKLDFNSIDLNSELLTHNKSLVRVVNILGTDIKSNYSGLIIRFFDDGTFDKKIILK